jgi:hypothetical protein
VFKSWTFKICAPNKYFKIITENYVRSRFCHQNRTRIDFGIMFSNIVVLYEIYSKKLQWPNIFGTSLYIILLFISFIYYKIKTKYNIIGGIEKFWGASHERDPL